MRSWVFRHRLRLRAIYTAPPLAVSREPAPARRRSGSTGLRPGEWTRSGRHVIVRPMLPPET
jgi:hypothetical protein